MHKKSEIDNRRLKNVCEKSFEMKYLSDLSHLCPESSSQVINFADESYPLTSMALVKEFLILHYGIRSAQFKPR